jgi:hypothetical protein
MLLGKHSITWVMAPAPFIFILFLRWGFQEFGSLLPPHLSSWDYRHASAHSGFSRFLILIPRRLNSIPDFFLGGESKDPCWIKLT